MSLESTLIEYGAPTLAGLKPASLFRYSPTVPELFQTQLESMQKQLSSCGIELVVLKTCKKTRSYLLYIYRQSDLADLVSLPEIQAFLYSLHYAFQDSIPFLIAQLTQRLCCSQTFPHEIGIFLGYPLEDVQGFMQHKGKNYTYCGYWKSYGDPRVAKRRFAAYRRCTNILRSRYANGTPIMHLVVAA